jgi:hypothetical protein
MMIQLKHPVKFVRKDGTEVTMPVGSYCNYSSFRVEPDDMQHILTCHDKKTGGTLRTSERAARNYRPAYL